MSDVKIVDQASLEAWLKTRPRRDAEIIAFRAAARVFPLWGRAMEDEWALRSTLVATKRDLTAMDYLRVLYTAYALRGERNATYTLSLNPASEFFANFLLADQPKLAIQSAYAFAECVYFNELKTLIDVQKVNARLVLRKAIEAFGRALEATTDLYLVSDIWAVDDVWSMEKFPRDLFAKQVSLDCKKLSLNGKIDNSPLWPTPAPDWFTKADFETRAIWAKDPATWAFWEKWWDGVISGDMPFAPDLLRDVALIDDDIWQAGPEAVAGAIAQIEKIHDLRAQLAALTQAMEDEDLTQLQRGETLAHRGHNNPPELIEAMAIVQASAVEIAQGLDDAREELAKPAPDPSRLKAIGTWMLTAIMKTAGYCGGLGDKFLQEFAGEMGKQAATVVAWLIKGGIGVSLLTAFAKSMIAVWPF